MIDIIAENIKYTTNNQLVNVMMSDETASISGVCFLNSFTLLMYIENTISKAEATHPYK